MSIVVLSHAACLEHRTPEGHPERPDRMRAIEAALSESDVSQLLLRIEPSEAPDELILRAHPQRHIDALNAAGVAMIDGDTFLSAGSTRAARVAAGACATAVEMVLGGEAAGAFCATRPPGHHAEHARAMGFCLFNNAAIGALHALTAHGLDRVAIIDFDVHHGNGVQDIFERDGRVFYASTHQWPLFPGTGREDEHGVGNILNRHLAAGDGSREFRGLYERNILPALDRFRPQLLIICAGFDAHWRDPLSLVRLDERDFAWATEALLETCRPHTGGRVVSTLEGGYDLEGLAHSCVAHVQALAEKAG